MRYVSGFVALAYTFGCRGSRDPGRDAAARPRTVSAVEADSGLWCRGDTTVRRDNPGQLVREFVARDGAGEFLSTSPFWLSATDCAGEGTDFARVISFYSIDSLGIQGDTARFRVTYHFLGNLVQAQRGFDPRIETIADTFLVVRRPWSWRIVGQHDVPTLLPDAAKAHWQLTPEDRTRLDSAGKASGR